MPGFAPVQKAPAVAPAQKNKKQAAAIQPKLSVNTPGDRYEKEADRTADKVMRSPASGPAPAISTLGASAQRAMTVAPTPKRDEKQKVQRATDTAAVTAPKREDRKNAAPAQVQRATGKLDDGAKTLDRHTRDLARDHDRDPRVQRKTEEVKPDKPKSTAPAAVQRDSAGGGGGEAPGGFETTLSRAQQAGGDSLSPATMQHMESGFGRSFGDVRVHSDGAADTAARAIDARAFTLGRDIYFAQGQYQPHSASGQHLLAHELTHVVQQSGQPASPQMAQRAIDKTKPATTKPKASSTKADEPISTTFEPPSKTDKRRIVREKDPGTGKAGTLVLNKLHLPYFNGSPKGINNHTDPSQQGQPAESKKPIRLGAEPAFALLGKTERGGTARKKFISQAKRDNIPDGIATALAAGEKKGTFAPLPLGEPGNSIHALKLKQGDLPFTILGPAADVAQQEYMLVPVWNAKGKNQNYEVDHMHEIQLGGLDGLANFWHLEDTVNRASGGGIDREVNNAITELIDMPPAPFWDGNKPGVRELRETWRIDFLMIAKLPDIESKPDFWTREQLRQGEHLAGLKSLTQAEASAGGLSLGKGGKLNHLRIFATATGGFYAELNGSGTNWAPGPGKAGGLGTQVGNSSANKQDPKQIFKGFGNSRVQINKEITSVTDNAEVGQVTGRPFHVASKDGELFKAPDEVSLRLLQKRSLGFGLYVDRKPLNKALNLIFRKASPVTIDDAGISPAGELYVEGFINTTTPLFPGVDIPFLVIGEKLKVEFPIAVDKLKLGPLRATWASISMTAGPKSLELDGQLGFAIEGLGRGYLGAGVSAATQKPAKGGGADAAAKKTAESAISAGFTLTGAFHFDLNKLDPADIKATYQNGHFNVSGDVGVQKDAIPGIDHAKIHVEHDDKGTVVNGTATLSVPGLEGTELQVSRDKDNRINIGADNIPLPVGKLPGVKSAIASIHAVRDPTGAWSVRGSGTVQAGVPGINGQLGIDIDGKLLTISGSANVARGIMSGQANLLVTNRPRTPAGLPQPGRYPQLQPTALSLTGKGAVSLQLGRLLKGTVGIEILPNEEIKLSGTVALPPTVDVFPKKSFEQVLFKPPPLDIPILGFSAMGYRVGVFATIGGALSFKASLGPGQLRGTALTVSYNPSHPDQASVHGDATFFVPAQAGLRLAVHAGIGAGLAIASVTGGVEVGAELGIAAEASAHVAVDWTPSAGVSLAANAHFAASPQFTFDVNAFVGVDLNLLIKSFEVYSKHWKLASFTYGPAMKFGLDVPVRWSEKAGLDFDPSRVQIQRPEIDIPATIGGLFHRMVG
jgi:hypothetical protein